MQVVVVVAVAQSLELAQVETLAEVAEAVVITVVAKGTLHIIIIQPLSAPRYSVVSNVRKCSAHPMVLKFTLDDHTMGNGHLPAICAIRPLAMKSPSLNIGLLSCCLCLSVAPFCCFLLFISFYSLLLL